VTSSATQGPVAAPAPARAVGGHDSTATAAAEDAADTGTLLVAREQQLLQQELARLTAMREGLAGRAAGKGPEVRPAGTSASGGGSGRSNAGAAAPPSLGRSAAPGGGAGHRLPAGSGGAGVAFGSVVEGGDVVPTPSHGSRRLPAEPSMAAGAGGGEQRYTRTAAVTTTRGTYVAEASVTITPGGTARVVGGRVVGSPSRPGQGGGGRRGSNDSGSTASDLSQGPLNEAGPAGYGEGLE
jgi:hypothetical protein